MYPFGTFELKLISGTGAIHSCCGRKNQEPVCHTYQIFSSFIQLIWEIIIHTLDIARKEKLWGWHNNGGPAWGKTIGRETDVRNQGQRKTRGMF